VVHFLIIYQSEGVKEGWRERGTEGKRDGGKEGWRDGGMEGKRDKKCLKL